MAKRKTAKKNKTSGAKRKGSAKSKTKSTSKKQILQSELVARLFGFKKEDSLSVKRDDIKSVESAINEKGYLDPNMFPIEEAYVRLSNYKESRGKDFSEPSITYSEGSMSGSHKKNRKRPGEEMINLHTINISTSIAEAMIIKTSLAILEDHGVKKVKILINNIGNPESQAAYKKEATAYYRKNINDLNSNCRQLFKESLHSLITQGSDQCEEIHEEAPKPMEFLDDSAKKRFSEVLEYLETFGVDYDMDQSVLGDPNYSTNTVFQIIDQSSEKVVAAGSRYDHLARSSGLRKDIPAMGATVHVPKPKKSPGSALDKIKNSKLFFMQIGFEAKIAAFSILDQLRQSNIYPLHKIYKDKLSSQIGAAKKSGAEYYIILGQKEAMDNDLIVRDKESQSQHIVSNDKIVDYLKKL
jgi:histidyl-tRNA synthetase